MFQKVLVANRGEIAVRILRSLREMGIRSVAVYSDDDADALHVRMADEAYCIGSGAIDQNYLNITRLLSAAERAGCDALHPGYGFLSENPAFAQACKDAKITFVGPEPGALALMGDKVSARKIMEEAGVPVVPGGPADSSEQAQDTAKRVGFPVFVKPQAGGGGKGMRRVNAADQLERALELARSEAEAAFGDRSVYIEKVIEEPRHVEIQIMGDQQGNVVHLFERNCSIQRRHQKVIEETPCPNIDPRVVEEMGAVSVRGAQAIDYSSLGTFEYLVDQNDRFYFLEMNTRLQVEHPVTEWTTGVDLVHEMFRIAGGLPLRLEQSEITRRGASVECRVYAEVPGRDFLPSPGTIEVLRVPSGPGVRDDSGSEQGSHVSNLYDPLISKLSVWAPDRPTAIARMRRALTEYVVLGVRNNLNFLQRTLSHPEFLNGSYTTAFIDRHLHEVLEVQAEPTPAKLAAAIAVAHHEMKRARVAHQPLPATTFQTSPWVLTQRTGLGVRWR